MLALRRLLVTLAAAVVLALIATPIAGATSPTTTTTTPSTTTTTTPSTTTTTTPKSTSVPAYWLVGSDGSVYAFGGLSNYGEETGTDLNKPVVGMAATPDSMGYWLVASDGGIFTWGDATFHGSTGGMHLNKPIVGMASTPDGKGYWLVATDGGIFAFGDAGFYGSMGNRTLNKPVVAMTPTADGKGYWLVASDGGIFAFGDAGFYGSTGNIVLNKPIVGMAVSAGGTGYWLVATDGGIFAFGSAPYEGSDGGIELSHPIQAMAATPDGKGYWFTDTNGAVTAFGDASYYGSAPQSIPAPIVGMAEATGDGAFTAGQYPAGSYGYDVSYFQCDTATSATQCEASLPQNHTIGVVEVNGGPLGYVNPDLAAEAQWAAGGLNLYTFLGDYNSSQGNLCNSAQACANYGYQEGQYAYNAAVAAGVNAAVGWWLDVEGASQYWTTSATDNSSLVQGALEGIRAEGVNTVGVYASPAVWSEIVGDWTPSIPYWPADWGINPATTCTQVQSQYIVPTGPVYLVQYSSPSDQYEADNQNTASYDNDYAC